MSNELVQAFTKPSQICPKLLSFFSFLSSSCSPNYVIFNEQGGELPTPPTKKIRGKQHVQSHPSTHATKRKKKKGEKEKKNYSKTNPFSYMNPFPPFNFGHLLSQINNFLILLCLGKIIMYQNFGSDFFMYLHNFQSFLFLNYPILDICKPKNIQIHIYTIAFNQWFSAFS